MSRMKIDEIRINQRKRNVDFNKVYELAESINLIGLMNPVTVNQNHELISGRHRIEAHRLLGKKYIEVKIANMNKLLSEMGEIDENIVRNELNDIDFGEHLIRRDEILEEMGIRAKRGDNRYTMNRGLTVSHLKTDSDIARHIGMSQSSVKFKKQIARYLIDEVREQLKRTEFASHTRGLIALSREDGNIQKKVVRLLLNNGHRDIKDAIADVKKDDKKNSLIRRLKMVRNPHYEGLILKHGDFRKVGKEIKDNSIDLIFTDPPYITEDSIELYRSLSILAKRVLKEGGSCLCYVTQTSLHDVLNVMTPHLKYWWIISMKHSGNRCGRHGRGIFVEWKPILWFVKGKSRYSIEFVADFIKSELPEKILHPWEQSIKEAEYYINYLSTGNGVVLDPMLGSGTTGVSALKLGRDFIGIEKDIDTFDIAKGRIWKSIKEKL